MNISDSITRQLKGVAIVLVIIAHLSQEGFINIAPVLFVAGAWGVSIFLFISGYGLSRSYLKNGITVIGVIRRFRSVFFPYAVVTLGLLLVDHFFFGGVYSLVATLKLLLAIDLSYSYDKTMWYISYIAIWYGLFYIIFSVSFLDKKYKVAILLFLSVVFSVAVKPPVLEWRFYYFVFPFGAFLGCYSDRLLEVERSRLYGGLAIVFAISLAVFVGTIDCYRDLSKTGYVALFAMAFLVCVVIMFYVAQFEISVLKWIGGISYEIYLLEGVLLWRYKLPHLLSNSVLSTVFYVIFVVVSAYILSQFISVMNRTFFEASRLRAVKISQLPPGSSK